MRQHSENFYLREISNGIPSERVFWVESTGNQTYLENSTLNFQTATEWPANREPQMFDIENLDLLSTLTVEFNQDGVIMTVEPSKAMGAIAINPKIIRVDIVATGDFKLMLRK